MNEQPKMAKQQAPARGPVPIALIPRPDGNLWLGGYVRTSEGPSGREIVHVIAPDDKTVCALPREEIFSLVKDVANAKEEIERLSALVAQGKPDDRLAALAEELDQKAASADALRAQGTAGALFAQQAVAYRDAAALLRLRFAIPGALRADAPAPASPR